LPARLPDDELDALLRGYGYRPKRVTSHEPSVMHQKKSAAVDESLTEIRAIQERARGGGDGEPTRWPMIVLRTPKGWTGPAEVDGKPVEGTWRAHQVPLAEVRSNPAHLRQLEDWLRSYRPEELFGADGEPRAELLGLVPQGQLWLGAGVPGRGAGPRP
jgi:xylulose-5-phosphate/fructose-6-phosphate phosphoketolase